MSVSFEPGELDTLTRLARARGVSVGLLVRELVGAVEPALGRAAALLETAARAQAEVPERLAALVADEASDMEALGELADLADFFDTVRLADAARRGRPGVNPRPVTRGLGWRSRGADHEPTAVDLGNEESVWSS